MQTASPVQPARRPPLALLIAVPILLAALLAAGAFLFRSSPAPVVLQKNGTPISSAIESTWGVRITQIAVIADGGLIDMRYIVLDPDKAQLMMNNLETAPAITADDGSVLSLKKPMGHRSDLEVGRSYYIIYVNAKGVLHTGSLVSVTMGDLRLDGVRVL